MAYNPAHQPDHRSDKCRCMCCACCCCYHACDCNNILCCAKGAGDCLCLRSSCCLACNTPHKGCGCTGDKDRGECCKLGLFCCDYALVVPTKLCAVASQCLFCYYVASLPCSPEYVPACVCTICCPGLQVAPRCGCCMAPPPCPALDKILRPELAPVKQIMDRAGPTTVILSQPPESALPMGATAGGGAPIMHVQDGRHLHGAPTGQGESKKVSKKGNVVSSTSHQADENDDKEKKHKKKSSKKGHPESTKAHPTDDGGDHGKQHHKKSSKKAKAALPDSNAPAPQVMDRVQHNNEAAKGAAPVTTSNTTPSSPRPGNGGKKDKPKHHVAVGQFGIEIDV